MSIDDIRVSDAFARDDALRLRAGWVGWFMLYAWEGQDNG